MPTFVKIQNDGLISLPTTIRHKAKLKEGDILEVFVDDDGSLRLIPKIPFTHSQAYFWTKRWQLGEKETESDLNSGRYKDFDKLEDLLLEIEAENE